MKELANQPKPQIPPFQLELAITIGSHTANGKLGKLDSDPLALLNNILGPDIQFIFPTKIDAIKAVVGSFAGALDAFWDRKSSQNVREQQFIDTICLLKRRGLNIDAVVERLSLHFFWGANS